MKTWFMNRRYKSGWRWCTMRWTKVELRGVVYLRRLHLVQTPLFSIMLHWILTPDPQPDLHDHPVDFWSIPLRGGYIEQRWGLPVQVVAPKGTRYRFDLRGRHASLVRINRKRAEHKHRIVEVLPGTVTLVFSGPVLRSWGFWPKGKFTPWRLYMKKFNEDQS